MKTVGVYNIYFVEDNLKQAGNHNHVAPNCSVSCIKIGLLKYKQG